MSHMAREALPHTQIHLCLASVFFLPARSIFTALLPASCTRCLLSSLRASHTRFLLHKKSFPLLQLACSTGLPGLSAGFPISKSLLTFQARSGPRNLPFHRPSFTTLCTLSGENILFLFCLFQQIVSPVNSEGLFSATWMGSSLFYMLREYLLSKWMGMCLDDCFWVSLHYWVHVMKSCNIILSYFETGLEKSHIQTHL